MEIYEDLWLSGIFGHRVFNIALGDTAVSQGSHAPRISDIIARHASQQSAATYYTKVETSRVETLRQLQAAGLYVVDVNITFGIDTHVPHGLVPDAGKIAGVSIGAIRPEHHQKALDIAASCFRFSRFHLDPCTPNAVADQVKHDWILNYIRKQRGETLLVAVIDEQPVGFLAVLASQAQGKRVRVIDLIGVHHAFQHRGIGRALGAFFIRHYGKQCDILRVGTQVANVPSMRLYQKLGFSVMQSTYVMHMHM